MIFAILFIQTVSSTERINSTMYDEHNILTLYETFSGPFGNHSYCKTVKLGKKSNDVIVSIREL